MTTVYVDPIGTILEPGPPATRPLDGPGWALVPGALDALVRLCEARYDLVILAPAPLAALDGLGALGAIHYASEPWAAAGRDAVQAPPERSWLVSADDAWSERPRPPGRLTVRVGPRPPDNPRPTARFDVEVRDLAAAALEILARDCVA